MSRYDRKLNERILKAKQKAPPKKPEIDKLAMLEVRERMEAYWDTKILAAFSLPFEPPTGPITATEIRESIRTLARDLMPPTSRPYPREWSRVDQRELEWFIGEVERGTFPPDYKRMFRGRSSAYIIHDEIDLTTPIREDRVIITVQEVKEWLRPFESMYSGYRFGCPCPACSGSSYYRGEDYRPVPRIPLGADVDTVSSLTGMSLRQAAMEMGVHSDQQPQSNPTVITNGPSDEYDPWNPRRITK